MGGIKEPEWITLTLEEIYKLVSSGNAQLIRYEFSNDKQGIQQIFIESPENITDNDVMIVNYKKRIMERKAYNIRNKGNNLFYLTETCLFFKKEDVPDVISAIFKNFYKFPKVDR